MEREEDGVERAEVESRLSGNFLEDFRVRTVALPESGGRSPCWCCGPPVGAVGDLLLCRDQHVILIDCDASVVRVEVHDEGGDVRGYPAYLRDAPRHNLVDD